VRTGASALYRYQENTGTNRGGSGGRLALRGGGSRLRGSVFVDAQRVSPAMAAGVTNRLFDVSDLVALLIEAESQKAA
jgi:hypothetical protein